MAKRDKMNRNFFLKIYLNFCVNIFMLCGSVYAVVPGWTALYRKRVSPEQAHQYRFKEMIAFSKYGVVPFSQLIFSWNIIQPDKGYFSFWGSVRDARTKRWYAWHKMADWGPGRQKSYLSKSKDGSAYYYVRLEAPKRRKVDAFRIKVIPHDGSDLSLMRGLYVSVSDLSRFKSEKNDKSLSRLQSVYITGVPKYSQMSINHERASEMCSPTSCSMMVSYLCKKNKVDPGTFALKVHDKGFDKFGSWPFNTAYAFEQCNGNIHFRVERLRSFTVLHRLLSKGMPVIVSVRGTIRGGFKEYDNGHLLVVVGFDSVSRQVLVHDPAFPNPSDIFNRYNLTDFLAAWERSRRLSYVAEYMPSEIKF